MKDSADCHYIVITESEAFNLKSAKEPTQSQETETEDGISKEKILMKQARKNLPLIKDAFLKYFRKKAELEQLVLQTPVNFLKDENGVVSGFNKQGNLVLICDSYGNYVNIIYDIHGRISSVYDNNNKTMQFEYANNLLQSITDGLGRTVKYQYDGEKLKYIIYPDDDKWELRYEGDNISLLKFCGYKYFKMTYENNKLSLLKMRTNWSDRYVGEYNFTYGNNQTQIEDNDGNREIFGFYDNKKLKFHKIRDNKRFETETEYTYNGNTTTESTYAAPDYKAEIVTYEYNDINLLSPRV